MMNTKYFKFILPILFLVFYSCGSLDDIEMNEQVDKGDEEIVEEGWVLVWEDNFDQDELFDDRYWSKIERGTSDWNNTMSMVDECFSNKNNIISLWGIYNDDVDESDMSPYLTGGIQTKGKYNFTEGRISIRAKLTAATGAWPAIWLLPENAGWPIGGEIDIMERLNFDSFVYQTVHSKYTLDNDANKYTPLYSVKSAIKTNDFNTYTVEVHKDRLVFFVNDEQTHEYPRLDNIQYQFPFLDNPLYLLIDRQLGGSWVGKVNNNHLPVAMEIDWVRYYKYQ